MKKLIAKAKEAVGIDSVSGKSFSDEMKSASEEGVQAKRLVSELHARLDRQCRLLEAAQAGGSALGEAFGEQSDALSAPAGKLAAACAQAHQWQSRLGEFEFSLRTGVQQVREHCKSWLDHEWLVAKQKERAYDASRKAYEAADAAMRKAAAPPSAAVDRDSARRALERDEQAALAAWRHANARALVLLDASLKAFFMHQASFFKQGALFFADKRKDADSLLNSTAVYEPATSSPADPDSSSAAPAKAAASAAVFGEPLGDAVPAFIPATIAYLEEHALHAEGLLRISGSTSIVQQFKAQVNGGQLPQFHPLSDHHNAAGLLKLYLREMPDPLCTFARYDEWVKATEIASEAERIGALRAIWQSLPRANRDIMQLLFRFCARLIEHAADNKMSASNVAIVIGPPILRCKADGDGPGFASDMGAVNRLANDLCVHAGVIFAAASGGNKPSIASAVAELDSIDDLLAEADAASGLDPAAVAANLGGAFDQGPTQYSRLPTKTGPVAAVAAAAAPASGADSPQLGARDTYGQLPKTGALNRATSRPASGFSAPVNKNPFRPATSATAPATSEAVVATATTATTGPKSFKALMQACGIVAMALDRCAPSFPQAARDEALRVARDIAKHMGAIGGDAEGADAVLAEGGALVQLLSSGGSLEDARAHSRRVTCAVHDLICAKENAVHQALAQRATEATHATASDISGLLRNAIAKQDAPEMRESAKRNCALLEALMVTRSLQVTETAVLADVTTQSTTVRQALSDFLDGISHVSTAAVVDAAVVDGLKGKAKVIITSLKQLSQDVLGATSQPLLSEAGEDDDALAAALGDACEAAAAALPERDEQLRLLNATQCSEPLLALAKHVQERTLTQASVVASVNKLVGALGLPQQGAEVGELGSEAVGWFALRNAQLAVAAAQLQLQ